MENIMYEEQSLEKQLEHSKAEIARLREEVVVVDTVWKQAEAELRSVRKQRDVAHDTFKPSVERPVCQHCGTVEDAHINGECPTGVIYTSGVPCRFTPAKHPMAYETFVLLKQAVEAQCKATASVTAERDQLKSENEKLRAQAAAFNNSTGLEKALDTLAAKEVSRLESENGRLRATVAAKDALLNAPELISFRDGVILEAAHQRQRWPAEDDAGKTPADWFWLVGYLAGKALHAAASGNSDKALHHTISTGAALANWHAAILGKTNMRPGLPDYAPALSRAETELAKGKQP